MKSLRSQLLVSLLLSAIAIAAAIGMLTYRETLAQNEALFDYHLRQMALSLRDQGVVEDPMPEIPGDETNDVLVQIWTTGGTMLYVSHPERSLPERTSLGFANLYANGKHWRSYSMIAHNRIIQVAQPFELRHDLAATAALRSLRPFMAFIPVMALLIWFVIERALHPLRRLEREVTDRNSHSFDPVSEADLPSEIAPVARALNSLLARLQRAFQGQRAFVADAAHELRSPLTALTLQLGLLATAQSAQDRSVAMANLNHGVDRASRLIEQLLTAARTELKGGLSPSEAVDLAAATRRAITETFALAQARRIDIGLDAPKRVYIQGDPEQLFILMRNLLDNAIRYTPENGVVAVKIKNENANACLYVDDSGPGIPPEERQRVFRRFYRGQSVTQAGNGLGLAIAKDIVEQHHGTITLRDSPLGGLQVFVCFKTIDRKKAAPPSSARPL